MTYNKVKYQRYFYHITWEPLAWCTTFNSYLFSCSYINHLFIEQTDSIHHILHVFKKKKKIIIILTDKSFQRIKAQHINKTKPNIIMNCL